MGAPQISSFRMAGTVAARSWPQVVSDSLPTSNGDALDALVHCARSGDTRAFREVTERLAPELFAYVRRRLAVDDDTAHDVVQDTFVLAWCNLDHIRDDQHLRPWLYRVALYRAVTWIRRRGPGGRQMASLEQRTEALGESVPTPASDDRGDSPAWPTTSDAASPVTIVALRRAMEGLKPSYRGVVRLHYLLGFDTREIAEVLGLTRANVKMRLFRARRVLRRLMREQVHLLAAADANALRSWLEDRETGGGS